MIVDVHAHAFSRDYLPLMGRLGGGFPMSLPATFDPAEPLDARFERMREAGVTRQILSPTVAPYSDDRALAADAARVVNDHFAGLVRQYPDRFGMWTSLPLPHVERSLDELRRGYDELGAVGVTLHCFCLGGSIVRPEFDPIYAALDARRAVVFLHPCQNGICSHLVNDWGLTVCAGASLEDSLVALHLIAGRIPERYPAIRFIVPHFGGPLPMLLDRLDGQMPQADLKERPSITARRFYYDTVGWGSKAALLCALEAFGAGQLVTGSDYPILLHWESYRQTFDHIRDSGLPQETVHRILTNAARLLEL